MPHVNNFQGRLAFNALKNCIRVIKIFRYQIFSQRRNLMMFYKNSNKTVSKEMRKYRKHVRLINFSY